MARIATALWIVWAIVVWNVVFDHVIVVAGREYISAATIAARGGTYARMDDWMRPAVERGLWIATATSATILLVGFAAIRRAATSNKGPADRLRQGYGGQAFANAQARNAGHYVRSGTDPDEAGPHDEAGQSEGVA
jgi:hypothetical protein